MNKANATPENAPAKVSRPALWLATGFGLGYAPVAPGTWGSLGGVLLAWIFAEATRRFLPEAHWMWRVAPAVVGTVALSLAGVWASRLASRHFRKHDPGQVVVDEISGQLLAYAPLLDFAVRPPGWKYLALGFILFRVFDIVKPFPARQAEGWPHGWGIMADDWSAAVYAALLLGAVRWAGWL